MCERERNHVCVGVCVCVSMRKREVKRSSCVLTQVSEQEIMVRLWDINDAFASLGPDNGGLGKGGESSSLSYQSALTFLLQL